MTDETENTDATQHRQAETAPVDGAELADRLVEASVLTEDERDDDLVLADRFQYNWRRRIEHLRDREPTDFLGLLLDTDPETLTVTNEEGLTVSQQGVTVGEWPSEAALVADVAAFVTLGEVFPGWDDLRGSTRDELVARLRVFLESCPACDGSLAAEGGETAESVPTVACEDCGAVVF